jgi:hypothetical protein
MNLKNAECRVEAGEERKRRGGKKPLAYLLLFVR